MDFINTVCKFWQANIEFVQPECFLSIHQLSIYNRASQKKNDECLSAVCTDYGRLCTLQRFGCWFILIMLFMKFALIYIQYIHFLRCLHYRPLLLLLLYFFFLYSIFLVFNVFHVNNICLYSYLPLRLSNKTIKLIIGILIPCSKYNQTRMTQFLWTVSFFLFLFFGFLVHSVSVCILDFLEWCFLNTTNEKSREKKTAIH